MNKFKHSGTLGDIVYALPLIKHLGGGEFYLHLNQINWVGQHYYNVAKPHPFHEGRMTQGDLDFMASFFEAQPYINVCRALDPKQDEVTHNLDRFRELFVNHPGNYVDVYCQTFNILDTRVQAQLRTQPWLTVPKPKTIEGRHIVVNRTQRWVDPQPNPKWAEWKAQGLDQQAVFVGLPEEYKAFVAATNWDIPHCPTPTMLDLAQVIAGAEMFLGNQSVALSLAIGLGIPYKCEQRNDLPQERNECYFPNQPNSEYF